jgi:hypothetical protein
MWKWKQTVKNCHSLHFGGTYLANGLASQDGARVVACLKTLGRFEIRASYAGYRYEFSFPPRWMGFIKNNQCPSGEIPVWITAADKMSLAEQA